MLETFDVAVFGGPCADLIQAAPLCELGPGNPNKGVRAELEALTPSRVLDGRDPQDISMARCCISGLWLLHNYLDESHSISQNIETPSGSYWHGIMHRREPDFSNGKYWFRRAGDHPIFPELLAAAQTAGRGDTREEVADYERRTNWDAGHFVDHCEQASHGKVTSVDFCRQVAWAEWQLLFSYCYRHAE